jgi:hypothetical protein
MLTSLFSLLVGITYVLQVGGDSAKGFLSAKTDASGVELASIATSLNADIEGGGADTCDDNTFSGCGVITRTVDWESNNVLFYRASAYPRKEGDGSVPWLKNKLSTMIANKAMLPQAFDESIIGNIGVVYEPKSVGAKPVCGYSMDGWVDQTVRQGVYDDGNGMSWSDGVDGCGACHPDTPDSDKRCLALHFEYLSSVDPWFSEGACPDPMDPKLNQQAAPCTNETFTRGLGKSYMPPKWGKATLPWKTILSRQAEAQSTYDHSTFQWAQSGYVEILLSVANLESSPDGVRAFWVDATAKSMDTEEKKRLVQVAMDQCITFNRDHQTNPTPLMWLDFDSDSGNYFSLASDCKTPGAASNGTSVRLTIEAAQQVGRGHEPFAGHEEQVWELDALTSEGRGVFRHMCLDLPHGDVSRSPQLWGCDSLVQQSWVYNTETQTLSPEVDKTKCLTLENGDFSMRECTTGDAHQIWAMPISGVGQIKNIVGHDEYCVDTEGGVTWASPSKLKLEKCDHDPAQNRPSQLWAMHCQDADGIATPCGVVKA